MHEPILAVVGTDAVVRMFYFTRPIPEGQPTCDDDSHPIIREPLNGNGAHSPPHRRLTRAAQNGRFVFLLGHEGSGTGVAFSREGRYLIASAADGTVRRWDGASLVPNTRIHHPRAGPHPRPGYIQGFNGLLRGLAFPDGTKIAGITPGRVFVVDLDKHTVAATKDQGWETGATRASDIAISPDGRYVAATGLGHTVRLYDPADLTKIAPPFRTYDTALVFHPDGSCLYCGNEDGRVHVFETATWTELRDESWQAHSGPVTAHAISNDQRLIATAGDTTLKLWLLKKPATAALVEMLGFSTCHPAAWLHFARDADGSDRALLNAQPFLPLEIWPGSRTPIPATSPNKMSPLKVLRAR